MIGNGRHQELFVGKLYDELEIPEKMAGFAQKTRGIGKESVHSVHEAFARSGKMPSVDCLPRNPDCLLQISVVCKSRDHDIKERDVNFTRLQTRNCGLKHLDQPSYFVLNILTLCCNV